MMLPKHVKVTKEWLLKAIAEEEKGAQEYERRGFTQIAGQERMHKAYLLRLLGRIDTPPRKEDPLEILRLIA